MWFLKTLLILFVFICTKYTWVGRDLPTYGETLHFLIRLTDEYRVLDYYLTPHIKTLFSTATNTFKIPKWKVQVCVRF